MDTRRFHDDFVLSNQSLIMRLHFDEARYPQLMTITSTMYDLELAHDLSVILAYPEYQDRKFDPYFWYRNGRRINENHRLRAGTIIRESPLLLELIVTAVGAAWVLVQILDRVSNWHLNREKVRVEIDNMRKDGQLKDLEILERTRKQLPFSDRPGAQEMMDRLIRRFEHNDIDLLDIDFDVPRNDEKR